MFCGNRRQNAWQIPEVKEAAKDNLNYVTKECVRGNKSWGN